MSKINDGGPAFPGQPWPDKCGVYEKAPGMSLRDWFAGQALALARGDWMPGHDAARARRAYEIADAMLAEREKRGAS